MPPPDFYELRELAEEAGSAGQPGREARFAAPLDHEGEVDDLAGVRLLIQTATRELAAIAAALPEAEESALRRSAVNSDILRHDHVMRRSDGVSAGPLASNLCRAWMAAASDRLPGIGLEGHALFSNPFRDEYSGSGPWIQSAVRGNTLDATAYLDPTERLDRMTMGQEELEAAFLALAKDLGAGVRFAVGKVAYGMAAPVQMHFDLSSQELPETEGLWQPQSDDTDLMRDFRPDGPLVDLAVDLRTALSHAAGFTDQIATNPAVDAHFRAGILDYTAFMRAYAELEGALARGLWAVSKEAFQGAVTGAPRGSSFEVDLDSAVMLPDSVAFTVAGFPLKGRHVRIPHANQALQGTGMHLSERPSGGVLVFVSYRKD